jgi:hypothetical protein
MKTEYLLVTTETQRNKILHSSLAGWLASRFG